MHRHLENPSKSPHSDNIFQLQTRWPDLLQIWVRLAPNGTNSSIFEIIWCEKCQSAPPWAQICWQKVNKGWDLPCWTDRSGPAGLSSSFFFSSLSFFLFLSSFFSLLSASFCSSCSEQTCSRCWILSTLPVPAYAETSTSILAWDFRGSGTTSSAIRVASAASCLPSSKKLWWF